MAALASSSVLPASRRVRTRGQVRAQALAGDADMSRRAALGLGAGAGLIIAKPPGAWSKEEKFPVENLPPAYKQQQREEARSAMASFLRDTAPELGAKNLLRLVWSDAATYDKRTGEGGFNGSVFYELERDENKGLKRTADDLLALKKRAEESSPNPNPLRASDFLAFAAKIATKSEFNAAIMARMRDPTDTRILNLAGNKFSDPNIGRIEASSPDPEGLVPVVGASGVDGFKAAAQRMGLSTRELCVLAECFGEDTEAVKAELSKDQKYRKILEEFERAKYETTRTNYESPFATAFLKLTDLGASFDPRAYLYPTQKPDLKL